MKADNYVLIGIDGGATKAIGWIVNFDPVRNVYDLSDHHAEAAYAEYENYHSDYEPVSIPLQLEERAAASMNLSDAEKQQGSAYTQAVIDIVQKLYTAGGHKPVLIGIGMPGLKTRDKRGINVINNGPRIIDYCTRIENKLRETGVQMASPVSRLGSDADYCGMGEFYANQGSFRGVQNAYYLGGGTGAADALLLKGVLIPFDDIKSWMAKTWELKNDKELSLERYASASGIQFIYAGHANIPVEELNTERIFPPQIAARAVAGDTPAQQTFDEVSTYLSWLLFERICTLFSGSKEIFGFINPNRNALDPVHLYRGTLLDRIVIGQRLGELMAEENGEKILTGPIEKKLCQIIQATDCLPEKAKLAYISGNLFKKDKIIFSRLREAPALGAAIDAHRTFTEN